MGVLDDGGGSSGVNVGRFSIVTNVDFVAQLFSAVRVATRLFPNYSGISCYPLLSYQ